MKEHVGTPTGPVQYPFRALAVLLCIGALLAAPTQRAAAQAEDEGGAEATAAPSSPRRSPTSVGYGRRALPSLMHVGIAAPGPTGVAFGATLGFGSTSYDDVSVTRLQGELAASIRALPWLTAWLDLHGRYDMHDAIDSGGVGDPRLGVRFTAPETGPLLLGFDAVVLIPGADAPSVEFGGLTIDAVALLGFAPEGTGLTIGSRIGFRLDGTSETVDGQRSLRPEERISFGVSEFNSLLLGLGVAYRTGPLEVLGEFSWDVALGGEAPTATTAPMRIGGGARYFASDTFQLELTAEGSMSTRPTLAPGQPLYAIEPSIQVLAGIRIVPFDAPPAVVARTTDGPTRPTPTTGPTTGTIRGTVLGPDGAAIEGARVAIVADDATREATTDAQGAFSFTEVLPGEINIVIEREGFKLVERTVTLAGGATVDVSGDEAVRLEPLTPVGSLRGLIRSFDGRGLRATIRVEPIGIELQSSDDGTFEMDVPPGSYTVRVTAAGFRSQERSVQVEANGVTVLNADLRRR